MASPRSRERRASSPLKGRAQRGRRARIAGSVGLALGVACLLTASTGWAGDPDPADARALFAESGRGLYVQYCAACHGVRGRGDGPVADSLRTRPADLAFISKRRGGEFPAAEIARTIDGRVDVSAHGNREMPVWGRRFGEHIESESTAEEVVRGNISVLVDYLRTLQRTD
ncbi:MAG: c-type cytochrome [Myxococcota bacterium]